MNQNLPKLSKNQRRKANAMARALAVAVPGDRQVVAVVNNGNPSNRTLRNRRRRQRQKFTRRMGIPANVMASTQPNSWHQYFQAEESATLEQSVHKMIQTQFFPSKGLHRGLARSFTPTALAFVKGSIDISNPSTAGASLGITLCPSAAAASAGFLNYTLNTSGGFGNPYAVGAATAAGPYNGAYPGGGMRVVSATLMITPEGALLNQGGAGIIFYAPNGQDIAASNGTLFTRNYLDNLPVNMDWNGAQGVILHWTPNDSETGFNITSTTSTTSSYGIVGCYLTGVPVGSNFRIEWSLGVEYVPNSTYTTLVTKQTASIHPDTTYWVSVVSQKHWMPLILSFTRDYMARLADMPSLGGHTDFEAITELGQSGMGDGIFDADIIDNNDVNPIVAVQSAYTRNTARLRGAGMIGSNDTFSRAISLGTRYASNAFSNALYRYAPNIGALGAQYIANRYMGNPNVGRIMPGAFN